MMHLQMLSPWQIQITKIFKVMHHWHRQELCVWKTAPRLHVLGRGPGQWVSFLDQPTQPNVLQRHWQMGCENTNSMPRGGNEAKCYTTLSMPRQTRKITVQAFTIQKSPPHLLLLLERISELSSPTLCLFLGYIMSCVLFCSIQGVYCGQHLKGGDHLGSKTLLNSSISFLDIGLESGHQTWLRYASTLESKEDTDPLELKGHNTILQSSLRGKRASFPCEVA